MNSSVKIIKLWGDATPYQKALAKQMSLVKEVQTHPQLGAVLAYEHPKVVTLGVRSSEKDLLQSQSFYHENCIEICEVNRGGEATFHNPGQLVIYPILHLPSLGLKVKDYICVLQKTTYAALQGLGIEAFGRGDEPGVYTNNGKIAFIGVKVSGGVCYHGIAININNELSDFEAIQSCGVKNQKLDRAGNYKSNMTPHSFFGLWFEQFLASIQP
ncbi:MAG: lipoyl(octanoyl) transferase LipB [Bdellovibrionales bacterium]|nr:lipoyl(octanoyl) transferase LipB [Bdellovibrionales bacterium]